MTQTNPNWQLVLIAWGTKYGVGDINGLVRAVRAHSAGLQRISLITDRPREGLDAGIDCIDHPAEFYQPQMLRGGCQAKLCMFKRGLLPEDYPAIFLDLDTVVMGDFGRLVALRGAREEVMLLQSAVLPFGGFARWLYRKTAGRRYARGNSSVVVFQPGEAAVIAEKFLELLKLYPDYSYGPMAADERFISWAAQPHMRAVPNSMVVKFPTEFMYPWLWLGRLRGAMPWVHARRAGLIAITLPGEEVKAEVLLSLEEGAIVTDRKGRKMEWSDSYLAPVRARLMAGIRAALPKDGA